MKQTLNDLANKKCKPCEGGTPSLKGKELADMLKQLNPNWKVVNDHHLEKVFEFPDFKQALAFTNRVGEQAEKEGHHPDIELKWGKVKITLWTHKIDGLSDNDFILAAKCDKEYERF